MAERRDGAKPQLTQTRLLSSQGSESLVDDVRNWFMAIDERAFLSFNTSLYCPSRGAVYLHFETRRRGALTFTTQ